MDPWVLACLFDERYKATDISVSSASWNLSRVDGLRIIADRRIGCGLRKSDQNPSRKRSITERLGARFRDRLMTRSCCFISRLSATMAFAPPGPKSLARVVNRCMSNKAKSFMAKQGRTDSYRAQDLLFCLFFPREVTIRHPQVGPGSSCGKILDRVPGITRMENTRLHATNS